MRTMWDLGIKDNMNLKASGEEKKGDSMESQITDQEAAAGVEERKYREDL